MSPSAITGVTLFVPCNVVKSLQLIQRSGTRRFHLRVPDLQISCTVTWPKVRAPMIVILTMATRGTIPYSKQREAYLEAWVASSSQLYWDPAGQVADIFYSSCLTHWWMRERMALMWNKHVWCAHRVHILCVHTHGFSLTYTYTSMSINMSMA